MYLSKLTNRNLLTFLLVGAMSMFMLTMNSCQECNKECCAKLEDEGEGEEPGTAARQLGESNYYFHYSDSLLNDHPFEEYTTEEGFEVDSFGFPTDSMLNLFSEISPYTTGYNPWSVSIANAAKLRTNYINYIDSLGKANLLLFDYLSVKHNPILKAQAEYQENNYEEDDQSGYKIVYGLQNPGISTPNTRKFCQMIIPIDSTGAELAITKTSDVFIVILPLKPVAGVVHCPPYCD